MAYDLRITRSADAATSGGATPDHATPDERRTITLAELRAALAGDEALHLEETEGMPPTVRSRQRAELVLTLADGEIVGDWVDDDVAETMMSLAERLDAALLGDDGERYRRGIILDEESLLDLPPPPRRWYRHRAWRAALFALIVTPGLFALVETRAANNARVMAALPAAWRPVARADSTMTDNAAPLPAAAASGHPAVVIMVEPDFNRQLAERLARRLAQAIARPVAIDTSAAPPHLGDTAEQVDASAMEGLLMADYQRHRARHPEALLIVLTGADINNRAYPTRYLFGLTFGRGGQPDIVSPLAIVSAYRLYHGFAWFNPGRVEQRLLTLALRAYAEMVLEMPRSTVPGSLMYSPLIGVPALDALPTTLPTSLPTTLPASLPAAIPPPAP